MIAGFTNAQVLGATNGIYIATAHPHYKHPVTGNIEDSGGENSSVLGQSMTESALYKQALVEVDASGNTYVTIRLQLMDNIQDPQFKTASGSGNFKSVSATLMQEDYTNNTSDFRMKVPDENGIIRCNMFVTAMGREVIFYITVSDLKNGNGDFVTSIPESVKKENNSQSQSDEKKQNTQNSSQSNEQSSNSSQSDNKSQQTNSQSEQKSNFSTGQNAQKNNQSAQKDESKTVQSAQSNSQNAQTDTQTNNDKKQSNSESTNKQSEDVADDKKQTTPNQTATQTATTTSVSESSVNTQADVSNQTVETNETESDNEPRGLQEFDAEGNIVDGEEQENNKETANKDSAILSWIIGGVAVVAVASGTFWYVRIYKKKQGGV